MSTTQSITAPEQRMILSDVSWETYESLLADYADKRVPRLTYDRGVLEIVSPTTRHERIIYVLTTIVTIAALEHGTVVDGVGSMTYKRRDLHRGFEPDASFYIQHARQVANTSQIDLAVDPPPDLIVEIDVTNSSLNKLPIYGEMGVPEIWRYNEATGKVGILCLQGGEYRPSAKSSVLPPLTTDVLTKFANQGGTDDNNWMRAFQRWIREASGEQS